MNTIKIVILDFRRSIQCMSIIICVTADSYCLFSNNIILYCKSSLLLNISLAIASEAKKREASSTVTHGTGNELTRPSQNAL